MNDALAAIGYSERRGKDVILHMTILNMKNIEVLF